MLTTPQQAPGGRTPAALDTGSRSPTSPVTGSWSPMFCLHCCPKRPMATWNSALPVQMHASGIGEARTAADPGCEDLKRRTADCLLTGAYSLFSSHCTCQGRRLEALQAGDSRLEQMQGKTGRFGHEQHAISVCTGEVMPEGQNAGHRRMASW